MPTKDQKQEPGAEAVKDDSRPEGAPATEGVPPDSASPARGDPASPSPRRPWWQNRVAMTIAVAIIAAAAPLSTAINGWSKLSLDREKHLHEIRQKYLDRVQSDTDRLRVLTFLRDVEKDERLVHWATAELRFVSSKRDLYFETIKTVASLARQEGPIDYNSNEYKRFWALYQEDLLPVESPAVEDAMVKVGAEIKRLTGAQEVPGESLRTLSFELARKMKADLIAQTSVGSSSVVPDQKP